MKYRKFDPYISKYVSVQNLGNANYRVLSNSIIPNNTIVEICPIAIITKKEAIVLSNAIPWITDRILVNHEIIDKEYQLFAALGELELEKRLDSGQITSKEYQQILQSKIDPKALLESKSHILMLGNGLLYRTSDYPNLICEYHIDSQVCIFKTVKQVPKDVELTYYK